MDTLPKKPVRPFFSSGPTAKRPGWSPAALNDTPIGRTHRSPPCQSRLDQMRKQMRKILDLPDDYVLMLTPGSATGALEMAIWNVLGPLPVDALAADPFGRNWGADLTALMGDQAQVHTASDFSVASVDNLQPGHDWTMVVNATPTGTWQLPPKRGAGDDGLTIVDITSAAFMHQFDWAHIDVAGFSWQKALGAEAQHGMLILSPKAQARLQAGPYRPLPKLMTIRDEYMNGLAVNTPSFLCVEDCLDALRWLDGIGGVAGAVERVTANANALDAHIRQSKYFKYAVDSDHRSPISVTFHLNSDAPRETYAHIAKILADHDAGFDLLGHRKTQPCLRVWCGPTVETDDIHALGPWLDYAAS